MVFPTGLSKFLLARCNFLAENWSAFSVMGKSYKLQKYFFYMVIRNYATTSLIFFAQLAGRPATATQARHGEASR
jgi:hypothetical protein